MLDSLLSVLNSKENRLYVDVVVALYDESHESVINNWRKQFLVSNEDCQVLTVKRIKQGRNTKGDRYILQRRTFESVGSCTF